MLMAEDLYRNNIFAKAVENVLVFACVEIQPVPTMANAAMRPKVVCAYMYAISFSCMHDSAAAKYKGPRNDTAGRTRCKEGVNNTSASSTSLKFAVTLQLRVMCGGGDGGG